MMKFNCCSINLLLTIILFVPYSVNASLNVRKLPDKAFCADEHCSKPISTGITLIRYNEDYPCVLSSKANSNVTVFSRSDDLKRFPLVEINGKRGFFPPNLFRVTKAKIKSQDVNVPVQFKCSDKKVIVAKAVLNEVDSSESNVLLTVPSKDQEYKGFIFAHASAAEASESQPSGYAPGHPPDFPASNNKVVGTTSGSSTDLPSGDASLSELGTKDTGVNINNVPNKAVTKSEKEEAIADGESSTEKAEDTSTGTEEDDDEEDDEDCDVDGENIEYSEPVIPSLQSSINDKTEAVNIVTSTPPVHPSTPLEGSVGNETPVKTPPVESTGLPYPSALPPPSNILPSKPENPDILDSEATQVDPTLSDQNQKKIAATDIPKTSESVFNQYSPESVSLSPTPLSSFDQNVTASQTESSQAESAPDPSKDASTPHAESSIPDLSPSNDSLTAKRSDVPVPESAAKVNLTDGSPDLVGDNIPIGGNVSILEGAVPGNETFGTSGEAKSVIPDHSKQPSLSLSSIKETVPQNIASQETPSGTQQEALPVQSNDFYRPQPGLIHQPIQPGAKPFAEQPNAGQPIQQPSSAGQTVQQPSSLGQPSAGPPAVDQTHPAPPPSPEASVSPPPPSPSPSAPESLPLPSPSPQAPVIPPLPSPSPQAPVIPPLPSPSPQAPVIPPLPSPSPQAPVIPPPSASSPSVTESSLPPAPSPSVTESVQPPVPSPSAPESLPSPAPFPNVPDVSSPPLQFQPQEYSSPPDVSENIPLTTPSPASEERAPAPPQMQHFIDTSFLYNSLSPISSSESGAPEQPTSVQSPADMATLENVDTSTTASEEPTQESPESSSSLWDSFLSFLSFFSSSESSMEPLQADVPVPDAVAQPDQIHSDPEYLPQQDAPQKDGTTEVPVCSDGSAELHCLQESFLPFQVENLFSNIGVDSLMTRIIAAAVTLLLCIIAYFFFENRRMDSSLVARVNTLERDLMVLSKENTLLKEECSSNIGQGQLEVILEELKEAKAARADLEEQVASLERDLDEAAEANMELNQMLAQTLENPKGSADDVLASVERLQAQLDGQRDTIGNMTRSLSSKNAEIESLKMQLTECRETMSGLEVEVATLNETIANVRREKEDANIAHVEKLQEVQNQLAEALANKMLEESRLGSELSSAKLNLKKTRQIVVAKESEIEALKESFKELKSKGSSDESVGKLFDAVKLHAQVEQLTQERDELEDSLRGEADARKRLEDHVRVIEEEVSKLRVNYEEAQKEKAEAQTRLEVLSNYFKEKEAQLKKECELQEVLLAQQRGDENSVLKQVKSLQEEVETYRSQNESLKREILDQERDLKGQIATLEKKSHDNWVSARQAERKLEEARQEASLLRNRLTLVEKNLSNSGEAGGVEANGEGGVISPVMGLPGMGPMGALMGPMGPLIPPPPPPIDLDAPSGLPPYMFPPLSPGSIPPPPHFIPPLPPPLMAGDRRPPPLGRMSSPPPVPPAPTGHFTPPHPHFDRLDRPSQSPSPTYHRSSAGGAGERHGFRPFAKPNPRKPTDYRGSNLSSGHSNEPMEKTRTNERV